MKLNFSRSTLFHTNTKVRLIYFGQDRSNKKLPFLDIVNAIEICALSLEKENQIQNAELLRQKITNAIFKNINFKTRSNLTFEQRTAPKELLQSTENKVFSYDKGTGFCNS